MRLRGECCGFAASLVVAEEPHTRPCWPVRRIERRRDEAYNGEGVLSRYTMTMLGGLDDNERHHVSGGR